MHERQRRLAILSEQLDACKEQLASFRRTLQSVQRIKESLESEIVEQKCKKENLTEEMRRLQAEIPK
jgi:predicted  nucleic acid-binding Zn-ribbon protein